MERGTRRIITYVALFTVVVMAYTFIYRYGMAQFDGRSVTLVHSFQIVIETFTTTGYGSDAPWTSPEMNVLVSAMQLTGVLLLFTALPVVIIPMIETALESTIPRSVDDLEDHVIICEYTARTDALIQELETWDVEYVVIEEDRELAGDLHADGYRVITGDPGSITVLQRAGVSRAKGVIADSDDESNASIVLSVKECDTETRTISIIEDHDLAVYHTYAGADQVISPRQLLGESIANKVTTVVSSELGETIEVGEDLEIAELPVQAGSDLNGVMLAESRIRERTGVSVIGAWFGGHFKSPPDPEDRLDDHTMLLVAGTTEQLERLASVALSETRSHSRGNVIVAGVGEVGMTVCEDLTDAGVPLTVMDRRHDVDPDVLGDATEPEDLLNAGIEEAEAIILALSDDTSTIFATLVARELNPDIQIVARANNDESVAKMYRAGADYVLALSTVSGRLLASAVLESEEVISFDQQVNVVQTTAEKLVGQSLAQADVRSKTGVTIVAVERHGELFTEIGPEFTIHRGDDVVIAGTDDGVKRFIEQMN